MTAICLLTWNITGKGERKITCRHKLLTNSALSQFVKIRFPITSGIHSMGEVWNLNFAYFGN